MSKHTPGPWKWRKYRNNWMLWGPDSTPILFVEGGNEPLQHPDGFLIQAAPELLAALKQCRGAIDGYKGTNLLADDAVLSEALESAIAAIAKAKGGAK